MKRVHYICNMCGAIRQASNHWFMVQMLGDSLIIETWQIRPAEAPDSTDVQDICGEACLHSAISQFVSALTLKGELHVRT